VSGVRYSSYLTRPQIWALDEACKAITEAFQEPPYLVGSVMQRPDFRDVDVRLILRDKKYDRLKDREWGLFGFVTSRHLQTATGLPVDFQVQRQTEANERYAGQPRNPIGCRTFDDHWIGDQR